MINQGDGKVEQSLTLTTQIHTHAAQQPPRDRETSKWEEKKTLET